MAVELAVDSGLSRFAVLGCGAVGLATARLLQRHGFAVTIYARELPPDTTSNIAGANWFPSYVVDRDRLSPEFEVRLRRASALSYRYFQGLVGDYYGVRWLDEYHLTQDPPVENWMESLLKEFIPRPTNFAPGLHPFGLRYVTRRYNMMIEPPIYLNALLRDFQIAGGKVVVREFQGVNDLLDLPEPGIVNCTGLGAAALVGDEEMVPVKGQLTFLLPDPEIRYITIEGTPSGVLYMMPRTDGILLGGTNERGVWSLEPDENETRRIVEGHINIFGGMT